MKKYFNRIYLNNSKIYQHYAVVILLIAIGVFLICNPISNTIKIGAVLTIIGFFLIVMKTEEKTANNSKELPIMFIMIIWTLVAYLMTIITNVTVDILFFLVLIGLLVINEFTSKVISVHLRKRMHFTIFIFLIIIVILLTKKIISISSM